MKRWLWPFHMTWKVLKRHFLQHTGELVLCTCVLLSSSSIIPCGVIWFAGACDKLREKTLPVKGGSSDKEGKYIFFLICSPQGSTFSVSVFYCLVVANKDWFSLIYTEFPQKVYDIIKVFHVAVYYIESIDRCTEICTWRMSPSGLIALLEIGSKKIQVWSSLHTILAFL